MLDTMQEFAGTKESPDYLLCLVARLKRMGYRFVKGISSHYEFVPFHVQEKRSRFWLKELTKFDSWFRSRLVLQLRSEQWDLMADEAANYTDPLELQARMLEIAEVSPQARKFVMETIDGAPTTILFHTLVDQAVKRNDQSFTITLAKGTDNLFRVDFGSDYTQESSDFPKELASAMRGYIALVQMVGYKHVKPFVSINGAQAENVHVRHIDEQTVELTVIAS